MGPGGMPEPFRSGSGAGRPQGAEASFQGASTSSHPAGERYLSERMAGRRGRAAEPLRHSPSALTDRLGQRFLAMGPRSTLMNAVFQQPSWPWDRPGSRSPAGIWIWPSREGWKASAGRPLRDFPPSRPWIPGPAVPSTGTGRASTWGRARAYFPAGIPGTRQGPGGVDPGGGPGLRRLPGRLPCHGPPHPEGAGAARAMTMALQIAHLRPEEIDLVSAHGTATAANDGAECLAIQRALGAAARSVSGDLQQEPVRPHPGRRGRSGGGPGPPGPGGPGW